MVASVEMATDMSSSMLRLAALVVEEHEIQEAARDLNVPVWMTWLMNMR